MTETEGGPNLTNASVDGIPIACNLSVATLEDRQVEWRALLDASLVAAERIPSGVRVTVQPSGSEELKRLVELERICCAWMQFKFDASETVAITASADGVEVLVAMFLDRSATELTRPTGS